MQFTTQRAQEAGAACPCPQGPASLQRNAEKEEAAGPAVPRPQSCSGLGSDIRRPRSLPERRKRKNTSNTLPGVAGRGGRNLTPGCGARDGARAGREQRWGNPSWPPPPWARPRPGKEAQFTVPAPEKGAAPSRPHRSGPSSTHWRKKLDLAPSSPQRRPAPPPWRPGAAPFLRSPPHLPPRVPQKDKAVPGAPVPLQGPSPTLSTEPLGLQHSPSAPGPAVV